MSVDVVSCVDDRMAAVGECPLWDPAGAALRWVDMYGADLHGLVPVTGARTTRHFAGHGNVAALAPCDDGRLLLGSDRGLHLLDPASGALEFVTDPRGGRGWLGFNDARCDPHGALWLGTYDRRQLEGGTGGEGVLFRVAPDGTVSEPLAGMAVVNGPAFAPDGRTIYVADTMAGTILAAPLGADGITAAPGPWSSGLGLPDGMTVDVEDHLWCAYWAGGKVVRHAPDGSAVRTVVLSVPNTTSCALGGAAMATLFVTTATDGLDAAGLAAAPLSGCLFAIEAGVPGLAERRFAASIFRR